MSLIQVCLILAIGLNVVAMIYSVRSNRPPSRWTDISAAIAVLATILFACGVA